MADADFRARALVDGKSAMEEVAGRPVETSVEITFVESPARSSFQVPLPPLLAAELDESELASIAGGGNTCTEGKHVDADLVHLTGTGDGETCSVANIKMRGTLNVTGYSNPSS